MLLELRWSCAFRPCGALTICHPQVHALRSGRPERAASREGTASARRSRVSEIVSEIAQDAGSSAERCALASAAIDALTSTPAERLSVLLHAAEGLPADDAARACEKFAARADAAGRGRLARSLSARLDGPQRMRHALDLCDSFAQTSAPVTVALAVARPAEPGAGPHVRAAVRPGAAALAARALSSLAPADRASRTAEIVAEVFTPSEARGVCDALARMMGDAERAEFTAAAVGTLTPARRRALLSEGVLSTPSAERSATLAHAASAVPADERAKLREYLDQLDPPAGTAAEISLSARPSKHQLEMAAAQQEAKAKAQQSQYRGSAAAQQYQARQEAQAKAQQSQYRGSAAAQQYQAQQEAQARADQAGAVRAPKATGKQRARGAAPGAARPARAASPPPQYASNNMGIGRSGGENTCRPSYCASTAKAAPSRADRARLLSKRFSFSSRAY